ncbi:MAG: type II toxin-antitoxin system RelE/ParE family toxin [Nitrospira sp.]|nr:type II toxin-antitoxin system RelE/ParE family toxin [Nitrospira sp.]MBH0183494.1 type II toxin-antitoxin system RelE/ParE family toxin [Nitrospira sp.]MBH0186849.1 type II toxin-antitoxin system RelE/ParE family toxin [Nitrospira sp.]
MTPLVWTRRAIEDVQSIQRFIEKDSPHYAQLVGQQLIAAVERLPTFPQSGRVVPEFNNPAIREVIQGSYRIVYRLIHGEIHILTVHHAARLLHLES